MNIRFWNTRAVARDIAAGRITESDAFSYFMALSLLFVAEGYLAVFVTPPITWLLLYEAVVVATITIVGVRAAYLANGGDKGKDFIFRFTCISFPISIKLALVGWALVAVVYLYPEVLVDPRIFADPDRAWKMITIFWVAAFSAVFYWRVWHYMPLAHDAQLRH